MESTLLPIESTVSPTVSPTASTFPATPLPFGARLFAPADLLRSAVDRARDGAEVFFAEFPLRLEAVRELALFLGLAVLGKTSS
jgi:hypothetical protein